MKQILTCMVAILLMVSLVACGSTSDGEIKRPSSVSTGNTDVSENSNDAEVQKQSGVSSSNTEVSENSNDTNSETGATIEETVLMDEGGVKITAKSLSTDEFFGAELNVLIENNSGKDLTIQCRNASVNGYMVETMMSVDIVNGKKANDTLTFIDSDLDACGIADIADMEFSFHMFTTDGWETYLDTAPIQLKTSIAETYEYKFDDSGNIAYDADGIKIIIKGLAEDSSIFGPNIVVYIENNTDKAFTVQSRDVSVNGFMMKTVFSCDVMPGKKAIDTITFWSSDLEKNEISAIENAELSFHIFATESWADIVDTDVVSINF